MIIKKFCLETDLQKHEEYLRNQYLEGNTMISWLPERLHDLIYRMDTQYTDAGRKKSSDYIFLWEENDDIIGCILPDGDAIYVSLSREREELYQSIVRYAEENCKPLFATEEDGSIDFLVINHDSLKNRCDILGQLGYEKQVEEDYDNFVYPQLSDVSIKLPDGYRLVYGDEYDNEVNKWSACNLGFHPELEDPNYKNNMNPYHSRKKSSMYEDCFESLVVDEKSTE